MKKLILGQVSSVFNPYKHLPVSPICFSGEEQTYPLFENCDYPNISISKKTFPYYDKLTNDEALACVNFIAEQCYPNVFEKYSFRFWKAIFYPWLESIIPFLYRKQLLIEKIVDQYKNEDILVSIPSITFDHKFHFASIDDYFEYGFRNIEFNEYVMSLFLMKIIPSGWQIKYSENHTIFAEDIKKRKNIKKFRVNIASLLDKVLYRSHLTYGFSNFDRLFFHVLFSLKKPIEKRESEKYNAASDRINWLIDIKEFLISIIPEELTKINLSSPPRKYKSGKLVNYSMNLYRKSRLDSAYAYQNGEIVIATQHGGHQYGSALTSESLYNTEFSSDYFISWGWNKYKEKNLSNILILPSPLLSKLYNKHKARTNDVIYVGTAMNPFKERFDSGMEEDEILEYRKNKLKFIMAYKDHFGLDDLLYKPYPERKGHLMDGGYILKYVPELRIIECKPKVFHKKMIQAKCLILDHPGTTLNIALALNTPVFLYWEKEWFPFNNESGRYLEEFEKSGVFHTNIDSLISKLKEIKHNKLSLEYWWNQEDMQNLRTRWLNSYGNVAKDWRRQWVQTLWNL